MDNQECKTTLNIERLETSWNAQFVSRFHTVASLHPKQTVGSHSYGVAILVNELWADASKELLQKALYHDVPEIMLGDICLLYTSPSPRDGLLSRMPSSA